MLNYEMNREMSPVKCRHTRSPPPGAMIHVALLMDQSSYRQVNCQLKRVDAFECNVAIVALFPYCPMLIGPLCDGRMMR